MFARNLGLSCFFLLKITNFLKQTFLKDLKKIKVNYQKVPVPLPRYFLKIVPVPVPTVLFLSMYRYRYRGTLRKYRAHL